MTDKLTESQVRHVARLSRLKLSEDEVGYFRQQLSGVIDYVDKLGELDVSDVEPMAHPTDMTNRFRDDRPRQGMPVAQALANAPQADPPFFKVPKVLGDGPGA